MDAVSTPGHVTMERDSPPIASRATPSARASSLQHPAGFLAPRFNLGSWLHAMHSAYCYVFMAIWALLSDGAAMAWRWPAILLSQPNESEPRRARTFDLVLLGHLLARRLKREGVCLPASEFARIWTDRVVPGAVPRGCTWQLGMTAVVTGLTSGYGRQFNGTVGRISSDTQDGRVTLIVKGPQGIISGGIPEGNLKAVTGSIDVLAAWQRLPIESRSQAPAVQAPQPRPTPAVHDAIAQFKKAKVEALVLAGANLADVDAKGRTALHVALDSLEEEAPEEEDEEEGAEDAAVGGGRGLALRPLLQLPMALARALLHYSVGAPSPASRADWLALVQWVLHHQADLNVRDEHERAPIHIAVMAGLHDVVRSLLEAGADPTLRCKGGSTLRHAAIRGDAKMIELLLLKQAPGSRLPSQASADYTDGFVNGKDKNGWTPLGLAARGGYVTAVERLLEGGADPAASLLDGKTALEIARLNKKEAVVSLLVSAAHS